jgi:RNA polymerase sigma-70 factor (ECF subfamily)
MGTDMTDPILIQRILDGDVEAYAQLVDRHYDRCARVAFRILGNREDAEEAIQDAFLRAYRALGEYEDRERFAAWIARILVIQGRGVLAKRRRRDELFIDVDPRLLDRVGALAEEGTDTWPELEVALRSLPLEQREAVVLRYADDLTYQEMAKITGAGESALKMRVQRAFARLRDLLQEVPSVR